MHMDDAQAAAPEVAPEATPVEVPVDAPATSPEATAAAAVPALRKDMPMAELKTYLNEFTSLSTGVKMFAHAKVGTEWFGNVTMATFFDLSSSRDRWQAVVDNLFAGDKSTADVFFLKVREAKQAEAAAAAPAAKRAKAAAAKEELLAKKRATDETGPVPEKPVEKVPTQSAFTLLMPPPKALGASGSFQDTHVIAVPFPKKGFDVNGSETYKAFRDEAAVHEKMIGWQLITEGFEFSPPEVRRAQTLAFEKDGALLPTNPIFDYHKAWRFRLSSIALHTLAEAYGMTVVALRHKKLCATHFLKMAAAAKQAVKKEHNEKEKALKRMPADEAARKALHAEELSRLMSEREILLKPHEEQLNQLKEKMSAELLVRGLSSLNLIDLQQRAVNVNQEINKIKDRYAQLEAQMRAKHMAQDAEHTAAKQDARTKRQKTAQREAAPAAQAPTPTPAPTAAPEPEPAPAPAHAPTPTPATTATPEPEPEPALAPTAAPEPEPAPVPTPSPAPGPGLVPLAGLNCVAAAVTPARRGAPAQAPGLTPVTAAAHDSACDPARGPANIVSPVAGFGW